MTDLNEWNLAYTTPLLGAISLDFGYSGDDAPLTVQVDVGDPERSIADQQHGFDDATMMGRDTVGGRDLTFSLTTLPDPSGSGEAINSLDKVAEIAARWRAYDLSHTPGAYATLTNKLRDRWMLGRPRQFTPKLARVRRGVTEYLAVFHTATPDFYQNPQHVINPALAVNFNQDIAGDLPAWPVVTFTGLFTTASLQWVPPVGLTGWTITINHAIATNIPVVVDTRPWARSARDNGGAMQNGWLAGNKMSDCLLAPSVGGHFLFTATGATDANTKCQVAWYDTYAGL